MSPAEGRAPGVRPDRPLPHVLVSSAARKAPLVRAVIEAARRLPGEARVFAGDLDPEAPAGLVADGALRLPPTEPARAGELRDLCLARGIGAVLPTRDGELAFWAEQAPWFREAGIEVIVSTPEGVALSLDKRAFAERGRVAGWPVVPVLEPPLGPGRFVVKERFGSGSASIGLGLGAEAALAHARGLSDPIFQPFVEGLESSVDAWFDRHHRLKGLVLRRRDRVLHGESVVTTTYRDEAVEAVCRQVLGALPLRGPVVAQLLRDPLGGVHLIEVNARVGGASTASIAAGLDLLYWSLLEAAGGDPWAAPFSRRGGEIRQVRLPCDLHVALPLS